MEHNTTPTLSPLVPSSANEDSETLRARFDELGYLYLQDYASSAKCDALLQQFMAQLSPTIVTDKKSGLPALREEPFFETDPTWDKLYPKLQSIQDFHQFFHEPEITGLMERLLENPAFVYPMKMARIATPGKIGYETPPHQDAHSHQGGPTMAGIWVALHDVAAGMGRLMLLPGSHRHGLRRVFDADGVGGVQCEIFPDETTWHVADVKRGDVIIFHSCCVHKAEPNTSDLAVRLSVDTRFCEYGEAVFVTNFEPHHGWRIEGFDWQSIYAGWSDDSLQNYWQDYPNVSDTVRVASDP